MRSKEFPDIEKMSKVLRKFVELIKAIVSSETFKHFNAADEVKSLSAQA